MLLWMQFSGIFYRIRDVSWKPCLVKFVMNDGDDSNETVEDVLD
jgi:hypothetical protein